VAITRVILHAGSLILSSCNKLKKASVHSSVLLLLLLLFFDNNNNRAGSNKRSFVGHPRSSLARVPAITLAGITTVTPVTRTPSEVVAERRSSLSALCACCVNFVIYNLPPAPPKKKKSGSASQKGGLCYDPSGRRGRASARSTLPPYPSSSIKAAADPQVKST
jgi:hypothetical protein